MPEGPEVLFMIDTLQYYCNKILTNLNILNYNICQNIIPKIIN